MPKRSSNRILYLRTFRERKPDHHVVVSLAAAVSRLGKLIVVGPDEGEASLQHYWRSRFGNTDLRQHVEYVATSDDQWRRVIHFQISKANCIFLYLTPKRRRFPSLRPPRMREYSFQEFYSTPLREASSGYGLLHEVTYLHRLQKLRKTIVLCTIKDFRYINRILNMAPFIGYSSDMAPLTSHVIFRNTPKGPRAVTPRFSSYDRQLVSLLSAHSIAPFARSQIRNPIRSGFSQHLESLVRRVVREEKRGKGGRRAGGPNPTVLLGKSSEPRRLPPDSARKLIQFTNVEDLLYIPRYEISDVRLAEVLIILGEEQAKRGCPSCKGPLSHVFFFVRALPRQADDLIRGRCQQCFEPLTVEDGVLIWFG